LPLGHGLSNPRCQVAGRRLGHHGFSHGGYGLSKANALVFDEVVG
jgi:hypothetical protein